MTVFATEKEVWHQTVFNHVWCAPLAGDHRVVSKVPPKVVGEILWPTFHFPLTQHIESEMVKKENSTWTFAFRISQTTHIDSFRPAMNCVKPRIAGSFKDFFGFNNLYDLRLSGIGFGIKDVDSR